jgi:hypothetical protein
MSNYTGAHATPTFLSLVDDAILRSAVPGASISAEIYPLPYTPYQTDYVQKKASFAGGFTFVTFVLMAASLFAGNLASSVVDEREKKVKHQQLVSGVNLGAYWLAVNIWSFLMYQVGATITAVVGLALDWADVLL